MDTPALMLVEYSTICRYRLFGAPPTTLYNTGSSGAPLGEPDIEFPPQVVQELSTALFGEPTNQDTLSGFLATLTNPGGCKDGGAFQLAFEDPLLFGRTDLFDAEYERFRVLTHGRLFS